MISPRITLCSVDIFTMTLKDAQENINNNNNKNYDSNNWPTSRELFAGWFSNSITGESVNCKLTGCRRLFCCRQVEVSNLPVRVYVLSEKDTEQVDDVDITKPLSFFRFIDWWTGINKRALLYHFCFSVKLPSSLPLLSSFFILSAPPWLLISFCGAVAILLHLASLLGCLLGACVVGDEMASGQSTKKKRGKKKNRLMEEKIPHCVLPHHAALVCHFLSMLFKHVWVTMHTRTHTCAHTHADAAHFI